MMRSLLQTSDPAALIRCIIPAAFCWGLLLLGGCFEPKDGCLDIEATNFDASADKNCCCEYPQLVIETAQRYDTLPYLPDSLYVASDGQIFRIKRIVFYLSEFEISQSGGLFSVGDTVRLSLYAPAGNDTLQQTFIDDFLLVLRTPVNNEVGEFRQTGDFEQVRFRLGLPPDAQRAIPALAPSGHPLGIQGDSLWLGSNTGYAFMKAIVVRDSMAATIPDTLMFTGSDIGDFFIQQTGNFIHASGGYDFRLRLTIDYKKMFEGVNWSSGDKMTWKSQIVANLPDVFTVSQ